MGKLLKMVEQEHPWSPLKTVCSMIGILHSSDMFMSVYGGFAVKLVWTRVNEKKERSKNGRGSIFNHLKCLLHRSVNDGFVIIDFSYVGAKTREIGLIRNFVYSGLFWTQYRLMAAKSSCFKTSCKFVSVGLDL